MAASKCATFSSIISTCLVFSAAVFDGTASIAQSRRNVVEWKKTIEPHVDFAENQIWYPPAPSKTNKFVFSALRFHLGYSEIKLASVARNQETMAKAQKVDTNLADLGLKAIYNADLDNRSILAVAPAGFPAAERKPIHLGLLKIDGIVQSAFEEDGPSAVLCLDSPNYAGKGFKYQIPTFYRTDDGDQESSIKGCRDAVQVGPRILEDPRGGIADKSNSSEVYFRKKADGTTERLDIYPGIPNSNAVHTGYFRMVFAVDNPGRDFPNHKSKENARNGYLIVTQSVATLWDLQHMLKSSGFYADERIAPWWAVNLVGGNYAGLIVHKDDKQVEIGNVDITQASALIIVRRH